MRAAKRYAKALFETAIEKNNLNQIQDEVKHLIGLIQRSKEFHGFLINRVLPPKSKKEIFEALFQGKMDPMLLHFLDLLADKKRERFLGEILLAFQNLVDEKNKIATAIVTSARALSPQQQDLIAKKLGKFSGYSIRIEHTVNPGLRGGFIVRLGDTVYDGSLIGQLEKLREQLRQGEFK